MGGPPHGELTSSSSRGWSAGFGPVSIFPAFLQMSGLCLRDSSAGDGVAHPRPCTLHLPVLCLRPAAPSPPIGAGPSASIPRSPHACGAAWCPGARGWRMAACDSVTISMATACGSRVRLPCGVGAGGWLLTAGRVIPEGVFIPTGGVRGHPCALLHQPEGTAASPRALHPFPKWMQHHQGSVSPLGAEPRCTGAPHPVPPCRQCLHPWVSAHFGGSWRAGGKAGRAGERHVSARPCSSPLPACCSERAAREDGVGT